MPHIQLRQLDLTESIPFGFELIAAPAECADLINTFFVVTSDTASLAEMMPAYSAQMMVYIEGSSDLRPDAGEVFCSQPVTCTAPLLAATPFTLKGPVKIIGASLTPLGWHCLSGLAADEVNNCMVPSETILDAEEIAEMQGLAQECRRGSVPNERICDAMADAIGRRRGQINAEHARFVKAVTKWLSSTLNPPLEALYSEVGISVRSAQRLCKRYFGVSPSRLVKRYRAIRAAMFLANPNLSESMRSDILGIYFDQAHLIRDIRRYTGRTPTALKKTSLMQDTLDPDAHGQGAKILR
ncbi:helix-turn-helix transcriptional regulator [Erythrobacter crassostreae]|uniref:Helix-turn-helix transcriptional regulator n=1 Tax=Erythrobacter crassostreae TaxID=2828328 RepID=A0A9X1F342_9SPHN|nr:helix-turn-helix transcriptional regulator [Erythrobacter crassostrea]MBV7258613.1 helix-turn-helix transcriptional regulator [Erythrobacter crassostrea]